MPDPDVLYPLPDQPHLVLLKPLAARTPKFEAGPFSYYSAIEGGDGAEFVRRNMVLRAWSDMALVVGSYCAIGPNVRFLMGGANHSEVGVSGFPFPLWPDWRFDGFAEIVRSPQVTTDTVVGSDVWIGMESMIMPGVRIGNGAIVAGRSVVTKDVPAYAVVAGNPATVIRHRFEPAEIEVLEQVAWWDWPIEQVTEHVAAIRGGRPEDLARIAGV